MTNPTLTLHRHITFSLRQPGAWATLLVAGLLGACGNSTTTEAVPVGVAINTQLPSVTLTADQTKALTTANTALASGNTAKAISDASAILATSGYNKEVVQTLGQAYAKDALMDSTSLNVVANGSTDSNAKLYGVYSMAGYETTATGGISPNYTTLVKTGDAALNMLVPVGTSATSLSPALQKEVAVASSVQVVRVLASVLQTPSPSTLTTKDANAAVDANYGATQQAQLETAAKLLVQTSSAAVETLANGSVVTSTLLGSMSNTLSTMTSDGSLDKADVKKLATTFRGGWTP
jgi:hypothetical protein